METQRFILSKEQAHSAAKRKYYLVLAGVVVILLGYSLWGDFTDKGITALLEDQWSTLLILSLNIYILLIGLNVIKLYKHNYIRFSSKAIFIKQEGVDRIVRIANDALHSYRIEGNTLEIQTTTDAAYQIDIANISDGARRQIEQYLRVLLQ